MSIDIGEKIRHAREFKNLTQAALASKVNISQPHLSELEKGGDIRWTEIEKIATALDIPIFKLLPDSINNTFHNSSHDSSHQTNAQTINMSIPFDSFMAMMKDLSKNK